MRERERRRRKERENTYQHRASSYHQVTNLPIWGELLFPQDDDLLLQTFHRHHHHHCLPPDLEIVLAPRVASPSVDQMLVVVQYSSVEGGTIGDYDCQGHSRHYHLNLSLIHQNVNQIFQYVLCPVQIPQSHSLLVFPLRRMLLIVDCWWEVLLHLHSLEHDHQMQNLKGQCQVNNTQLHV